MSGVADWDHRVSATPNQLHRNRLRQITSVEHGDHLAAPVHHCAQGASERRRRGRLRQVGEDPEHVGQVSAQRGGPEHRSGHAPDDLQRGQDQRQTQERQRLAAHRQRGDAQCDVDVLGHATGAHQDQPVDQLGELVAELHRDATTQRVPDHGDPVDVEHAQQVPHAIGVGGHRVVGAGFIGLAVAQQIWGDDGEPLRQLGLNRAPRGGVVADSVDQQNCRSGTRHTKRAPISVDGAVLQRGREFPHRTQVGLSRGHCDNLAGLPSGRYLESSSLPLSACCRRNCSNSAPSSSPLGRSSSLASSDRFSCAETKASY